jgi:hypothetical protein
MSVGTVPERAESHGQESCPLGMFAVAPLDQVHAVRMIVLVHVSVQEPIRPAALIARSFLDRRLRLDTNRCHPPTLASSRRSGGGSVRGVGGIYAHWRTRVCDPSIEPRGCRRR